WNFGGALGRVFGFRRRSRPPAGQAPQARSTAPSPGAARPASWGTETKKTIAVLPFKNLSGDPAASFYQFSLADGIITQLATLKSIVVRPSTYVAQYTGTNSDPRQVGEDLAVGSVLTGSFYKAPDRIRVTAQLLTAASGEIVWSDKIDIAAKDLITI